MSSQLETVIVAIAVRCRRVMDLIAGFKVAIKWLKVSFVIRVLLLFFVLNSGSFATLTDSFTIGNAKALSLGHAVTADPPGIDSIHYNPAGIVRLRGRQTHYKVLSGDFSIKLKFGDYIEERKNLLEGAEETGNYPDGYFYDEAHNTVSKTEGATMMLPFVGMTDIPVLLAPLGGMSYSPDNNPRLAFASNVYTPLAAGFNRAPDDPGRFIGERLSFLLMTYLSPTVAYQFNDHWAVGATLTVNYAGIGLDLPFRSPHIGILGLGLAQGELCENGQPVDGFNIDLCGELGLYDLLGTLSFEVEKTMTFGFNFGVLWTPNSWFSAGFVYQSKVSMDMKGDFSWENSDTWNNFLLPILSTDEYAYAEDLVSVFGWSLPQQEPSGGTHGSASIKMKMPEHYALGVSVQVTPKIKVNLDAKFTGWSVWQEIPVKFSEAIDFMRISEIVQPSLSTRNSLTFPLGLKDTWNYGIGIEYQWKDNLVLRAGLETRPTSIPEESESPLLPMGEGTFYGFGFGRQLDEKSQLDVGIGYFSSSTDMPGGSSRLGNSTDPTLVIYNPYAGTDIEADLTMFLLEMSYSKRY